MTSLDITHQRLRNQGITEATLRKPSDVVGWLGAVQAQDYAGAKWAVVIETDIFARLTKAENRAVAVAAHRYGEFLERSVVLA